MNRVQKILLGSFIFAMVLSLGIRPAVTNVNNNNCTVKDEDDTPGNASIFSLRGRLDGFNSSPPRACIEKVSFQSGESFVINLNGALSVDYPNDGDTDGDGDRFVLTKGGATQVIINAGNIDCAFKMNLANDFKMKMVGIEIHSRHVKKTICNKEGNDARGSLAPGSDVIIKADDDRDHDGFDDDEDVCPDLPSDNQTDSDLDGEGDECDTTPPTNPCGNGTDDSGEECDGGQCCDSTCHFKPANTACNDGNSSTTDDKCNASGVCAGTSGPACGNGTMDTGEDCDPGAPVANDCCDATCHFEAVDTVCDDGVVATTGDKCNATGVCAGTAGPAVCGNGSVEGAEGCDDSNTTASDGCSATCTVEPGFNCVGSPSVCTPIVAVCGNGTKEGSEGCDDNNTTASDGCSATCTVESGFTCTGTSPSVCSPIVATCGNGTKEGSEGCDDGNTTASDGCSATCAVESGFTCTSASPSVCTPTTGGSTGGSTSPPTGSGSSTSDSNPDSGPTIGLGNGTNTGGCSLMNSAVASSWVSWAMLSVAALQTLVIRSFRRKK